MVAACNQAFVNVVSCVCVLVSVFACQRKPEAGVTSFTECTSSKDEISQSTTGNQVQTKRIYRLPPAAQIPGQEEASFKGRERERKTARQSEKQSPVTGRR